jgi:hypothetical protein
MNRVLRALTTIATILGTATPTRPHCDQSPIRFRFELPAGPRGVAVEDCLRPRPSATPHARRLDRYAC